MLRLTTIAAQASQAEPGAPVMVETRAAINTAAVRIVSAPTCVNALAIFTFKFGGVILMMISSTLLWARDFGFSPSVEVPRVAESTIGALRLP